jgi:Fe-S-cluster-containing dehydrogenase component/formate-dependent nitrite reductase membrane component NrfD
VPVPFVVQCSGTRKSSFLAASAPFLTEVLQLPPHQADASSMTTFGFLIDNRKCIGCHACTVACKSEHDVPIGVDRTWVKYIEKGEFPNTRRLFTVMRCNHCEWAPCVTICPVTALYKRADGVVDFNNERCIGCKACMQACPYDALYIDPESNTAAKCNFCTHRLEVGLEPSCVVVCPERAIVCGDLDDSGSEISRLINRFPTQVRKPEKGTKPKLYYIDGDEAALVPTAAKADGQYLWSGGPELAKNGRGEDGESGRHEIVAAQTSQSPPLPFSPSPTLPDARRVYDVRPRKPIWSWAVVGYIWTKSIAAGAFLAAAAARLEYHSEYSIHVQLVLSFVAMLFLVVTGILLVVDLKQPKRFLYVLLRPQWQSWLVRGAYVITAYGAVLAMWFVAIIFGWNPLADALVWPGAILALLTAVYTAFLFAQAKGRDLWQNPLFSMHLLAHAVLAAGATWLIADVYFRPVPQRSATILAIALVFSLVALLLECFTAPPTDDSRRAIHMILGKPMGGWFWGAGILVGHIIPLLLLATGNGGLAALAAVLALAGMGVIEWLWVSVPQRIPLS